MLRRACIRIATHHQKDVFHMQCLILSTISGLSNLYSYWQKKHADNGMSNTGHHQQPPHQWVVAQAACQFRNMAGIGCFLPLTLFSMSSNCPFTVRADTAPLLSTMIGKVIRCPVMSQSSFPENWSQFCSAR